MHRPAISPPMMAPESLSTNLCTVSPKARERDKKARDDCGAHPGPVEKRVDRVRNHDRHRGLQGKLPMRWITERVGDEGSSSRVMRFGFVRRGGRAAYRTQEDGQRAEQSNHRRGLFDTRVGALRERRHGVMHLRGGIVRLDGASARSHPACQLFLNGIRQIVGNGFQDHQRLEKRTYHRHRDLASLRRLFGVVLSGLEQWHETRAPFRKAFTVVAVRKRGLQLLQDLADGAVHECPSALTKQQIDDDRHGYRHEYRRPMPTRSRVSGPPGLVRHRPASAATR